MHASDASPYGTGVCYSYSDLGEVGRLGREAEVLRYKFLHPKAICHAVNRGRSSSYSLQKVLTQIAALALATGPNLFAVGFQAKGMSPTSQAACG